MDRITNRKLEWLRADDPGSNYDPCAVCANPAIWLLKEEGESRPVGAFCELHSKQGFDHVVLELERERDMRQASVDWYERLARYIGTQAIWPPPNEGNPPDLSMSDEDLAGSE